MRACLVKELDPAGEPAYDQDRTCSQPAPATMHTAQHPMENAASQTMTSYVHTSLYIAYADVDT
eukprot:3403887-Karenia_brevis.AAC.1